MVGSSRSGLWLTRNNKARDGGSSSILSSAFEACRYCISSAVSTMQRASRPRTLLGRGTNRTPHILDADHRLFRLPEFALITRSTAGYSAMSVRASAVRRRRGGDLQRARALHRAPRPDWDEPERTAPCDRPASPCRCRDGRRSARHGPIAHRSRRRDRRLPPLRGRSDRHFRRGGRIEDHARPRPTLRSQTISAAARISVWISSIGRDASITRQRAGSPLLSGSPRANAGENRPACSRSAKLTRVARARAGARQPDLDREIQDQRQIGRKPPATMRYSDDSSTRSMPWP